jgi:hypothetical protein
MAVLATYLAGLCDYSDELVRGERGVVLLLAPDMKQAKVLLDYAEGTLESTPLLRRTAETLTLTTGVKGRLRLPSLGREEK